MDIAPVVVLAGVFSDAPLERARQLQAETDRLARHVQDVLETAQMLRQESIHQRMKRSAWRRALYSAEGSRQPVIVMCAGCQRLRTPEGVWTGLPEGMSPSLPLRWRGILVSHGMCPNCLAPYGLPTVSNFTPTG